MSDLLDKIQQNAAAKARKAKSDEEAVISAFFARLDERITAVVSRFTRAVAEGKQDKCGVIEDFSGAMLPEVLRNVGWTPRNSGDPSIACAWRPMSACNTRYGCHIAIMVPGGEWPWTPSQFHADDFLRKALAEAGEQWCRPVSTRPPDADDAHTGYDGPEWMDKL